MKKTKNTSKIFSVLCAIFSVVFACVIGITYCVSSLNLKYGINPASTSAYLANQQYHIINDTIDNPITFGSGTHNFEIGMQYSFPYDVDMCFKYSLTWSKKTGDPEGDINTDNVILNFSNRDNIILDQQNIYIANSIPAGSEKVIFINGVEFVDVNDSDYFNRNLTISISDVKIYKKQSSYDSNHLLYKNNSSSLAAQIWLDYKTCSTSETSKVLMYNYRRDYEHGMPYVSLQTAYKQTVTTNSGGTELTRVPTWLGGNKGYAGIGMYIVTGKNPIKLSIQIEGVWYDSSNLQDSDLISENSIRFNYAKGWSHDSWYNNKMWEKRTFDYVIAKESACYIDILDSVEITSVSKSSNYIEYDTYRMVTSEITINAGGTDLTFEYSKDSENNYIQRKELTVNKSLTGAGTYSQKDVEVVNTSLYSAGLYTIKPAKAAQGFKTSISLINNTQYIQSVTVQYSFNYNMSNGYTNLKGKLNGSDVEKRADEYVSDGELTQEQAFIDSSLYYSYSINYSGFELFSETVTSKTYVVGAYSSVNLVDSYDVSADLQDKVTLTDKNDSKIKYYYDVWTYFDIKTTSTKVESNSNPSSLNLQIESNLNSSNEVVFSVKNNSNKEIEGVSINKFAVNALEVETYKSLSAKPNDWGTYFWRYYKKDGDDYVSLTSDPFAGGESGVNITNYYEKVQSFKAITSITLLNSFSTSSNITSNSTIKLMPGESVEFAKVSGINLSEYYLNFTFEGVSATSSVTTPTGAMLINGGNQNAYIVNDSSETSYYIYFTGNLKSTVAKIETETTTVTEGEIEVEINYNYYLGILRPGQVISVPMTSDGELKSIVVSDEFIKTNLVNGGWSSTMANKMERLFNINKTS